MVTKIEHKRGLRPSRLIVNDYTRAHIESSLHKMPALIPVVFLLSIGWVARFQFAACTEGRSSFYNFFTSIRGFLKCYIVALWVSEKMYLGDH